MKRVRHFVGFTLIELLIVIAIVAILTTIAAPAFSDLIAAQRVKSAASTLQSALYMTRSEALKRNVNVTLAPVTTGQWNGAWSASLSDGTVLSNYNAVAQISIANAPASVTFLGNGRISASADASFKLTSGATATIRCVDISLSGVPKISDSGC